MNNNQDEDQDWGDPAVMETAEDCPKCKEKLIKYTVFDGPDDYKWEYKCNNCGYTESE